MPEQPSKHQAKYKDEGDDREQPTRQIAQSGSLPLGAVSVATGIMPRPALRAKATLEQPAHLLAYMTDARRSRKFHATTKGTLASGSLTSAHRCDARSRSQGVEQLRRRGDRQPAGEVAADEGGGLPVDQITSGQQRDACSRPV